MQSVQDQQVRGGRAEFGQNSLEQVLGGFAILARVMGSGLAGFCKALFFPGHLIPMGLVYQLSCLSEAHRARPSNILREVFNLRTATVVLNIFGMTRVASEDSVRRGMRAMDEAESEQWLNGIGGWPSPMNANSSPPGPKQA